MTAAHAPEAPDVPADLSDVQRLVLKGFVAPAGLHIGLAVRDAGPARAFLGRLADPSGASGTLTTALEWHETTGVCLTVGVTFAGLRALGVPEAQLASFPAEFRAGAAARASVVGDRGPSRPAAWLPWLRGAVGGELHVLLSLLGTEEELEAATRLLAEQWQDGLRRLGTFRAKALPTPEQRVPHRSRVAPGRSRPLDEPVPREMLVHFGYRDGFSQPTIGGLPQIGLDDPLQRVPVGALVLGHALPGTDRRGLAYSYPVPGSEELGRNGSFAAFRVLEQDVHAFEAFLQREAERTGSSAELLAAKLCGRWRDGTPLVLRPDDDAPPVAPERLNDFDYAGGGADRGNPDPDGLSCPLGAHIRRMNPRRTPVAGAPTVARHRRIVRRGMPYGPPYDPDVGPDGVSRGLVGLFIGASLRDSYEFVLQEWANDGAFSASLGRTQDPLLGAHDRSRTDSFPLPGSPHALEGLPRFVTSRGGAYLFLPSATALRHLAGTTPDNPAAAVPYAARHRALAERAAARVVGSGAVAHDDAQWAQLLEWFITRRGALLRELLEDSPVLETPTAVVVSRYGDVREVLETSGAFGVAPYRDTMRAVNRGADFLLGLDDGPQYRHDRALLLRAVTARDVDLVRAQVRREAPVLLADPGPVDVVRYAKALTVRVAAERLGVRGLSADSLVELCHSVFLGIFVNLTSDPLVTERAIAARDQLRESLTALVQRGARRSAPSDDALGRLVAIAAAGELDAERVVDQLIGLLVGLVDNVVAGICSATHELLSRPHDLAVAQAAADSSGDVLARCVWEVLRFAPPAPLVVRASTRRHVFASGRTVEAGRLVLAVTAAAMVDPREFRDPYAVRLDRAEESSLHFGAGMHRCLGRHVGGTLVVEAVRALLQAGVQAAPEPDPGLVRLTDTPVRYLVRLTGRR